MESMRPDEIRALVAHEIAKWNETKPARRSPLTPGAIELLVQIIENISYDPSPGWLPVDLGEAQARAIERIPIMIEMLTDTRQFRGPPLTTWEILHNASRIVEELCFIKKRGKS